MLPLLLFLVLLTSRVQAIGIHYNWQANINPTGLANSIETSHKEYNSKDNNFFENLLKNPKGLGNLIGKEFKLYPYFLSQRNVLLGLIQVIQEEKCTYIKLNLPRTSFTLFKFGTPKSELQQWCTGVEDVRGSIAIATTIPILGGILTLEHPESSLQFKSICNYHSSPSYTLYKNDKEYIVKNHDLNVHLETRIVDYKPSLVGMPPKRWRKVLYLNTQRYFHVYVMRRFHGHVYSVIEKDMNMGRMENDDVENNSNSGGDSVRAQRFEFNRESK